MAKSNANDRANDPNSNEEFFFKQLGSFLRKMRKAAGFKSIRSFVDMIEMSYSQYQGYESGKNLTLAMFRKMLLQFNVKVEDWLKLDIFNNENVLDDALVENMKIARIEQLRGQVIKTENKQIGLKLSSIDIERYIKILIFCNGPQSRSKILRELELGDTVNNFKRVAGKLIEYNWLELTDKDSPNSPKQQYVTTSKGKAVLRLEY